MLHSTVKEDRRVAREAIRDHHPDHIERAAGVFGAIRIAPPGAEEEMASFLWWLAADRTRPESVRREAAAGLVRLGKLPRRSFGRPSDEPPRQRKF
jgi:hypothetical protein